MVGIAGTAVIANAATLRERNHYARAGPDGFYILADFLDDAGEFMSQNRGQLGPEADPSPIALPQMPVRTADAAGFDANDRAVVGALRRRPVSLYLHRLADFFQHHCFHQGQTSVEIFRFD